MYNLCMHDETDGARADDAIRRAEQVAGRLETTLRCALADVRAQIVRLERLLSAAADLSGDDEVVADARRSLELLREVETRHAWLDGAPPREASVPKAAPPTDIAIGTKQAAPVADQPSPVPPVKPEVKAAVELEQSQGPDAPGVPQPPPSEPPATDAAVRHRKSITKKRLVERLNRWLEETRPVPDVSGPDVGTVLGWKRLVCEGRLLLAALTDYSMEADVVEDEMRVLSRAFERLGDDGSFFAFNRARVFTPGGWDELSRAVAAACASLRASKLVRDSAEVLKDKERRDLAARSLAAAQWAKRILSERASVADVHVGEALRSAAATAELLSESGGEPVPPARGSRSQIAKSLIEEIAAWEETAAKRGKSREAERLIEEAPEDEVLAAIRRARSLGLPASNPILLDRAATVRKSLSADDDAEVIKFLEQREARIAGRAKAIGESRPAMKALDPEQLRKCDAVRAFCEGKVAVILGGKAKNQHAEQYRQELGFSEVIWPDTEKRTRPATLEPLVDRGDIVIYNPKFSRHAYKSVADRATQNGKVVITLDHGYGVDQILNTMYEQLSRRGYLT